MNEPEKFLRDIGEVVYVPKEVLDNAKKKYPKKDLLQQRGFALDELEKQHYSKNFDGWKIAPCDTSPYDIEGHDIFCDFKLCSARTVTISASECYFAGNNPYCVLVYKFEKPVDGGFIARFMGGVAFDTLTLHNSKKDNSEFAWLDDIAFG